MKKSLLIMLVVASFCAIAFVYQYFEQVLPFVHLNITMDSSKALSSSNQLAQKYNWPVQAYDSAVQFTSNSTLQAFVELEGGGKPAFIEMLDKGYHQPYKWIVRFYKPGTIYELYVAHTPDGLPYEFKIQLPEDQTGNTLSRAQALEVATQHLSDWNVNLSDYDFVEYHTLTQLCGRVDHTFVYERRDITLQKGLYRLNLKVCGDIFAEIDHNVKIPNEFERRYAEMFANNMLLASMGQNLAVLIYVFFIFVILAMFFYRDRSYLFLQSHLRLIAMFWFIMFLSSINQWSLIWNYYPTHMSVPLFIFNNIFFKIIGTVFFALLVGIISVLVDAADRFMFKNHIQMLKSWSWGVGGSYTMLQMTLIGYCTASLMLGYEIGYTLWAQYMGWWAPLYSFFDPNLLSAYVPFVSPVATAFQAGFFEEIVFRGLPLAGIAFVTRNSPHKKWWFLGMVVVQAVIFGALHANYAMQPAYYRIVELMVPGFVWAYMYYSFGLLPGIIMHFVYDATLMCLPVFISNLLLQKILCVVAILLPALVVFVYWLLQGRKFVDADASAYNQASVYQEPQEVSQDLSRSQGRPMSRSGILYLLLFGLLGIGLLKFSNVWNFAMPEVTITNMQAQSLVTPTMAKTMGVEFDDTWTVSSKIINTTNLPENKFIWQTYGADVYSSMLISIKDLSPDESVVKAQDGYMKGHMYPWKCQGYVAPTHYMVSWKKFVGPVEDRAEEITFMINAHSQDIIAIRHLFPEGAAGADLSEHAAQKLALKCIQQWYFTPESDLELVSCESKLHAQRRDFKIVYKDNVGYDLDQGQGHIIVRIAGDQLSEIQRRVHVPEQWSRAEKDREMKSDVVKYMQYIFIMLWYLFAFVIGMYHCGFSIKIMKLIGISTTLVCIVRCINLANFWPAITWNLNTVEPWMYQIISLISAYLINFVITGFIVSWLYVALVMPSATSPDKKSLLRSLSLILLGVGVAGFEMFVSGYDRMFAAPEFYCEALNFYVTAVAMLIRHFWYQMCFSSLTFFTLCSLSGYIQQRCAQGWVVLLFMLAGVALSDIALLDNIALWIGFGFCFGLIWYFLYRCIVMYDLTAIWLIFFGIVCCKMIPSVWYGAYPDILVHFSIVFGLSLGLLLWLYRKI